LEKGPKNNGKITPGAGRASHRYWDSRAAPPATQARIRPNEPWTIGHSVSAGCIRMTNEDVADLYDRIPVGTKVIVLATAAPTAPMQ
jgi:hypothetical protein